MYRVPPVGGESVATWRLSGEVVGSGQCVCTRGECLHRSGAGATSRSHLRGSGSAAVAASGPQYRQISTDPGFSPDRETFQTENPGNRFQPTQNSMSAFGCRDTLALAPPRGTGRGQWCPLPAALDQGSIQNPAPDS